MVRQVEIPADPILVTGAAGFIGFHLSNLLCQSGHHVVGLDNMNEYYDRTLKDRRLEILNEHDSFHFHLMDLISHDDLRALFESHKFKYVVNLAAQAGVRYSITNPLAYARSNMVGFLNVLEACRLSKVEHLVFASSSSVYGANTKMPYSTSDIADHPISLYAATKKSNEMMAHSYSSLYNLPCTGLRFFTVYGPWGRPDMALFKFTQNILAGKPIDVYNNGEMIRDFTYIDDIVQGIVKVISNIPKPNAQWNRKRPDPSSSFAPYKIFNLGNNHPVELEYFIKTLEESLGKKAIRNYMPLQPGDVPRTCSDNSDLTNSVGYKPKTKIEDGVDKFVDWYLSYYDNES